MPEKSNIEEFKVKSKQIHQDKYDYSKFEYINSKTKGIIICPISGHGEFLQTPTDHYNGGCKKCGDILRGKNRKFTTEEIIKKSKEIHGETYDYSNIEYINGIIENIKCKIHGLFSQLKYIHIDKKGGCKKCGDILRGENRKFTTEDFKIKSKKVHGETYDYSKSVYTGMFEKIIIICKKHGEFLQQPNNHINAGCGCNLCAANTRGNNIRKSTEDFIIKAKQKHGELYDYSKSEYTGIDDEITIICIIHGEFNQVAYSHINGQGCPTCGIIKRGINRTSNTDEFIEKAKQKHGELYDYSKSEYIKSDEKIIIICKKHGEFLQQPNNHINSGYGCVLCQNKTEGKLYEKLQSLYPTIITQFKQEWCKKITYLPFDFCIPELKIIIELDGRQHFQQVRNWSSPEEQFENDIYKQKCANENGYSVIRLLQEDVFNDSYDWNKELCETIENIKNNNDFKNVYLCKNCEYKHYN